MEQRQRIAIVDNDPDVRVSLEDFLRSAGLTTRGFDSVPAFLDDAGLFNAVITDLHMPGQDGLALLEAIAARGLRTPVIVITGAPTEDLRTRSQALGAWAFLAKPVLPDRLLQIVETALEAHQTPPAREHGAWI